MLLMLQLMDDRNSDNSMIAAAIEPLTSALSLSNYHKYTFNCLEWKVISGESRNAEVPEPMASARSAST